MSIYNILYGYGGLKATVTLTSDVYNFILRNNLPAYAPGSTSVELNINSGVVVGATSTGVYALYITSFTSGDAVRINNNGYISGAGGNGGPGAGAGGPGAGQPGGPAVFIDNTLSVVTINNNGVIQGGGGGGGGTSGYQQGNAKPTYVNRGAGGGGGAGRFAGAAGAGLELNGSAGSLTAGGSGGRAGAPGYDRTVVYSGAGGGPGAAGGSSTDGYGGGGGGLYMVGINRVSWVNTGTLYGGAVNS